MERYKEKYVYMITNLINDKKYIGQSINPKKRFQSHCEYRKTNNKKYVSLISQAIQKYGKENFKLSILYFGEDYNEKEKDFIQKYDTLTPNGYNIMEGGENPPVLKGENSAIGVLTEKEVK